MSKRVFEITIGRSPLPILRAGVGNIRFLFAVGAYFMLSHLTVDNGGDPRLGSALGLISAAWVIGYYLRIVVAVRLTEDALDLVLLIGRVRYGLSTLNDIVLSRHRSYSSVSLVVHAKGGRVPHFYNILTTANERDLALGQMPALIAAFKREGLLSQALPTHT